MHRSPTALKEAPSEDAKASQMDWAALLGRLQRTSFHTPLRWTRISSRQPERIRPWKIREKLRTSRRGISIQVKQVLSGEIKTGDIQPVEWLTTEFEVDRNLARLERQKIDSGENVAWDTWVRITPPEVMNSRQANEQREYTKGLHYANDREAAVHGGLAKVRDALAGRDEWGKKLYWLQQELKDLPPEFKPRKMEEIRLHKLPRILAYRRNHREGWEGWREWRVSLTIDRMNREKAKAAERRKS